MSGESNPFEGWAIDQLVLEMDGEEYTALLYDPTNAFSIMHTAMRLDRHVLDKRGYVARDRSWHVRDARVGVGGVEIGHERR